MSLFCSCFTTQILWREYRLFSHGIALEFNPIGGLNETIQDRIGDRWIVHGLSPVFNGQLTGRNGRASLDSVVENLKDIFLLSLCQRDESPIIKHQNILFFQGRQDFQIPFLPVIERVYNIELKLKVSVARER